MPEKNNSRFQWRSFTSFTLFLSFFFLAASGLALYLRPEGSIANWTAWKLIGIDKTGWEGIHTFFCVLFLSIAVFHIVLNGNTLLRYLYDRLSRNIRKKKELVMSAALVGMVLFLSVFQIRPFWDVMDLRSSIKKGSHLVSMKPPEQDFDRRTLFEAANFLQMPLEQLMRNLQENGLSLKDENESLSELARRNHTSPQKVFMLLFQIAEQ